MSRATPRRKAMRGRIALQKHYVRNSEEPLPMFSRQLWECVRVLAPLFRSPHLIGSDELALPGNQKGRCPCWISCDRLEGAAGGNERSLQPKLHSRLVSPFAQLI